MKQKLEGLLLVFVITAVPISILLGIHAWQQRTLLALGSPTPRVVPVAELQERGAGDNIHVTVTDLIFGEDFVYETKSGAWNCVWIPVYPAGGPAKGAFKVLIRTFKAKSDAELEELCRQPQVTGLITNAIHRLGGAERDILHSQYPDADLDSILMVEDRKVFPSEAEVLGTTIGAIGLGVLAVAAGILLLVKLTWRRVSVANV